MTEDGIASEGDPSVPSTHCTGPERSTGVLGRGLLQRVGDDCVPRDVQHVRLPRQQTSANGAHLYSEGRRGELWRG